MNQSDPEFLAKISPDIARLLLLKLSFRDILNFCQTNKILRKKVCTEFFWKDVASSKLKTTTLGGFKSWSDLIKSHYRYGLNDLISISQDYENNNLTKKEAIRLIYSSLRAGQLTYKGKDAIKEMKKVLKEEVRNDFQQLADENYYDPTYDPENDPDAKEIVLEKPYFIYYSLAKDFFLVYDYDVLEHKKEFKLKNNENLILLASDEVHLNIIEDAMDEIAPEINFD